MNIVLCSDNNLIEQTIVLINSIFENCLNYHKINIFIISEFENIFVKHLKILLKKQECLENIKIIKPDRNNKLLNEIIDNVVIRDWLKNIEEGSKKERLSNIYNWVRFILPELLPNVNKMLYLDIDMIVKDDIEKLWNSLPDDQFFGSCYQKNLLFKVFVFDCESFNINGDDLMFNAGMYITKLDYWRENNLIEKIIKLIKRNRDEAIYCGGNQPLFNIIFYNKTFKIDSKWNVTGFGGNKKKNLYKIAVNDFDNAKIVHWSGSNKSWMYDKKNLYNITNEWYKNYKYILNLKLLESGKSIKNKNIFEKYINEYCYEYYKLEHNYKIYKQSSIYLHNLNNSDINILEKEEKKGNIVFPTTTQIKYYNKTEFINLFDKLKIKKNWKDEYKISYIGKKIIDLEEIFDFDNNKFNNIIDEFVNKTNLDIGELTIVWENDDHSKDPFIINYNNILNNQSNKIANNIIDFVINKYSKPYIYFDLNCIMNDDYLKDKIICNHKLYNNYRIIFISCSKFDNCYDITKKWLDEKEFFYDKIIFTNNIEDQIKLIKNDLKFKIIITNSKIDKIKKEHIPYLKINNEWDKLNDKIK